MITSGEGRLDLVFPGLAPGVSQAFTPAEQNCGNANREVDRSCRQQRGADPDELNQKKPGEARSGHRAECVQAVQAAQGWLEESTIFARECARQDRQCPSHERGRNQQDQRR